MSRRVQRSPWPRRFLLLGGITIIVVAVQAFSALRRQDLGQASAMFFGVVGLLVFEMIVFIIHNRQQR